MPDQPQVAAAMQASADTLLTITRGYRSAQALCVAATHGIADLLAAGPVTVDELAVATSTHAPSLLRLLRALASIGVFAEDDGHCFRLTPLAEPLRSDAPRSVHAPLRLLGDPVLFVPWGQLLYSVQTGRPAFDQAFGMGMYAYLAEHADAAGNFNAGMAAQARHHAVLDAYDFGAAHLIIDVGGGNGRLIAAILRAHPAQQGILYDLPEVIAEARGRLEQDGLGERCQVVGGSFLESVPEGGDLYVLSDVLHNWDDARGSIILAKCRKAMAEEGRLIVIQQVLSEGNERPFERFADLNMLTLLGGRERSADDFRQLLAAAGFTLTRIIPTRDSYSIVEAVPTPHTAS